MPLLNTGANDPFTMRTRCLQCRGRLLRRDRSFARCPGCRRKRRLAAWHRRARSRTSILTLHDLLLDARRQTIGRTSVAPEHEDARRRADRRYEQLLRERGIVAAGVNEPPPGWTVEADIREEWLALSEHLAMRR